MPRIHKQALVLTRDPKVIYRLRNASELVLLMAGRQVDGMSHFPRRRFGRGEPILRQSRVV